MFIKLVFRSDPIYYQWKFVFDKKKKKQSNAFISFIVLQDLFVITDNDDET